MMFIGLATVSLIAIIGLGYEIHKLNKENNELSLMLTILTIDKLKRDKNNNPSDLSNNV